MTYPNVACIPNLSKKVADTILGVAMDAGSEEDDDDDEPPSDDEDEDDDEEEDEDYEREEGEEEEGEEEDDEEGDEDDVDENASEVGDEDNEENNEEAEEEKQQKDAETWLTDEDWEEFHTGAPLSWLSEEQRAARWERIMQRVAERKEEYETQRLQAGSKRQRTGDEH